MWERVSGKEWNEGFSARRPDDKLCTYQWIKSNFKVF